MCRIIFLITTLLVIVNVEGGSIKKKINKCCHNGHHVGPMLTCVPYPAKLNFSSLKVFDDKAYETGKSVEDVFTLVPGILEEEEWFRDCSYDLTMLEDENLYIIEDGTLLLEMPNTYDRWKSMNSSRYCVDYRIRGGVILETPHIWAAYEETEEDSESESNIVFSYATIVSCFFMLLVLAVYMMLPELQNLCGMILMAYVTCLFLAFYMLVIIQLAQHEEECCVRLTFGIYFFLLASFCWMNVMSFDIWWTFRGYAKARPIHRRGEDFKFCMYGLYAFGVPGLMTVFMGVMNKMDLKKWPWIVTPNVPKMGCFLEGGMKLYYLYMPMLILIICNWMFYLMTAFNIWRLSRGTAVLDSGAAGTPQAHRSHRQRFMVYLKLSVVMGLNWLLEIISFLYPGKVWNITDLYNILIGFFIFLIFVCKKKIYKKLVKSYACKRSLRGYPSTRSYSSSASDQETATLQSKVSSNPRGTNFNMNSFNANSGY